MDQGSYSGFLDFYYRYVNMILSKSYSRFGRNMVETLSAIKELREAGIRIIFIEDNLDSTKDTTNFGLFSWLAEMESKKTSERIKTVFDNFKEKGKIYNYKRIVLFMRCMI